MRLCEYVCEPVSQYLYLLNELASCLINFVAILPQPCDFIDSLISSWVRSFTESYLCDIDNIIVPFENTATHID